MTKREAKRLVAQGAIRILEAASDQGWLHDDYSNADSDRMVEAYEALLDRLAKSAGHERRAKNLWK